MRYSQYPYRRSSLFGYFPPGIRWLLISNTLVFLVYFLGGSAVKLHLTTLFALWAAAAVRSLFVWQLFTYMFLHAGITHLLFNMLTLWMFGATLERDWGTRKFLKYYFLCGIGAGVCDVTVKMLLGDPRGTIGASGAIFGVLLAFGVLYPETIILFFFVFPIQAKYFVMIYGAMALLGSLNVNGAVSEVAHLGGMIFGLLYLKVRFPKVDTYEVRRWYRNYKMQRAKKKFQVYMRKHPSDRGPWVN